MALALLVVAVAVFLPRLLRHSRAIRKAREDERVRDAVSRALETATD